MKEKIRADIYLVKKGLAQSREQAKAMIIAGEVYKRSERIHKPGVMLSEADEIVIKTKRNQYISRGALKLEAAIKNFAIDVKGLIAIDIGASTGGFTDVLLKNGAEKVYAVDVGYGILHPLLRNNPKVILMERTNARFLKKEDFKDEISLITIDCSFISLKLLLPVAFNILKNGGICLPLVKPQFEIGKGEVGKGGVVREEEKRLKTVEMIKDFSISLGFEFFGFFQSSLKGPKGNIEYFLYLKKGEKND